MPGQSAKQKAATKKMLAKTKELLEKRAERRTAQVRVMVSTDEKTGKPRYRWAHAKNGVPLKKENGKIMFVKSKPGPPNYRPVIRRAFEKAAKKYGLNAKLSSNAVSVIVSAFIDLNEKLNHEASLLAQNSKKKRINHDAVMMGLGFVVGNDSIRSNHGVVQKLNAIGKNSAYAAMEGAVSKVVPKSK